MLELTDIKTVMVTIFRMFKESSGDTKDIDLHIKV